MLPNIQISIKIYYVETSPGMPNKIDFFITFFFCSTVSGIPSIRKRSLVGVEKDLLELNNFLGFMNTPIIKAKKGTRVKSFYNESDYKQWKQANNNGKGWVIKYYKGLGTSTAKEFKKYFDHKKIVSFKYNDQTDDNAIDMVFNKHRSNDRKKWLGEYNPNDTLNTNNNSITNTEHRQHTQSGNLHQLVYHPPPTWSLLIW